ncbi:MAG TPA: hypothetical protein VGS05_09360 [Candidatus Sulfotelmatobacter sp.]|nr:hypothetical protein [Candidatus Sulfotelmatobacter sp.]
MQSGSKQLDAARLKADLAAACVELLSAQCAMDRVRLQYSPHDVVAIAERGTVKKALASAEALYRFFSQIEAHIRHREEPGRRDSSSGHRS